MRIVHLCLAGQFAEGYSYQENLLTKYQAMDGHKVFVLAYNQALGDNGNIINVKTGKYINVDGVHIIRIRYFEFLKSGRLKYSSSLYKNLTQMKPDILFIHGIQFLGVNQIIKYKKNHPNIKIFVDNHADFSNSARSFISRNFLHKILWKHNAQKIEKYSEKFYGVMPSRVDFLIDVYNLNRKNVELMTMGGDDEFVSMFSEKDRINYRKLNNINDDEKIIVTGGKIDNFKKETIYLMQYVNQRSDLKLIIFGSVEESIRERFDSELSNKIKYFGWVDSKKSYELFNLADLVVFPGRHSVYWEQVVSMQKPMIAKFWNGTTHIDIGGNCHFVDYTSMNRKKLFKVLDSVLYNEKELEKMKCAAKSELSSTFLYSSIAKKSIGGKG